MSTRDYIRDWVSPEGREYRMEVYNRQREGGTKPLVDNPRVEDLRAAIAMYDPRTVLEVGCGWGRLVRALLEDFSITFAIFGCDISRDMIGHCQGLPVLWHDICADLPEFHAQYDVVFCRGLMLYLTPDQQAVAMRNMSALARKKVLVWEWTDVCEQMQSHTKDPKFEFHAIPVRDE